MTDLYQELYKLHTISHSSEYQQHTITQNKKSLYSGTPCFILVYIGNKLVAKNDYFCSKIEKTSLVSHKN